MEFKLIIKKLNGTLTPEEATVFDQWFNESPKHAAYFEKVKVMHDKDVGTIKQDKAWRTIERKLERKTKYRIWRYAAAAVFAGIVVSTFLFRKDVQAPLHPESQTEVVRSELKIGTDKAILTLTDGTEIALEKGSSQTLGNATSNGQEIVYQPTYSEETVPPEFNYLTVPRGGQFSVALSDGTQVWLNSESQLKYPVAFAKGGTRVVELLYGEAYFEVSPSTENDGAPFKVATETQEVTVLGTQFNIKAYGDEETIQTTLVEGKVQVNVGKESSMLRPKQQSIVLPGSNKIEVKEVDVYSATSWKKGIFSFNDMPLGEIMKVLARWYDIDVVFGDPALKNSSFTGVLRKNQHIEVILESIKTTTNMKYEINKKTVIFK
ncbi:DUF4974 domain-containing protein [Muricauda oceani]|uniref:FecR family protein n=1 Tax=Flagellimonas oceani TaxID=2698672 RepID=A0A6G7J075_9FLAO|nr:FecR domain-containing protein [Allomuricauda oceani]MBW8243659.1 DUF4974 domain-containing protein [Allomuricauda oceani]QII43974.1 FecR family protein [Allomuricauda oceani]